MLRLRQELCLLDRELATAAAAVAGAADEGSAPPPSPPPPPAGLGDSVRLCAPGSAHGGGRA